MIVTHTIAECRKQRRELGRLALVPTMGALHVGHLKLVEIAHQHARFVAVSIFVNPTQFGPKEDFTRYPRPIEKDLEMCREAGVDLIFNPSAEEMYPSGHAAAPDALVLDLPPLTSVLEGKFRPGHFRGVCQVVAKLFNVVMPDVALFGKKDYQQLCVLTRMVQELDFPIEIVPCETIREPDGLAMSSRNRYLSADERKRALAISRGLAAAHREFLGGVRQANKLVAIVQNSISQTGEFPHVPVTIDYVAAADAESLQPVDVIVKPAVIAVAARVGGTRLIDNAILKP